MFRATTRRLAQRLSTASKENLTIHNNPYRARKTWPPDFSQLTPQQQLRFEKKHKRRVTMAQHSPKWDKTVRLVRFIAIIACVLVMTFGAEYRFWGGDYVYKPTEEIIPKIGRLFGLMDPEKKFREHPDVPEARKNDPEKKP